MKAIVFDNELKLDTYYKSDIAILYQKTGSENLGMFRYLSRVKNIVIDV